MVEGVYADDRAGHGCCNLPAEEFFADRVWILHCDSHDRLAHFLQGFDGGILRAIGCGFETEIREDAIGARVLRLCDAFAVHAHNYLPTPSAGFRDELLEP